MNLPRTVKALLYLQDKISRWRAWGEHSALGLSLGKLTYEDFREDQRTMWRALDRYEKPLHRILRRIECKDS